MRIILASSEAVPFAKTGGLADVSAGLAKALSNLGHEVTLILPCYRKFIKPEERGDILASIRVELRHTSVKAELRKTMLPGSSVEVLLVDQGHFFDRSGLYTEDGADYPDNAERFIYFSRVVAEYAATLGRPDVIHLNDWQTGLVPALVAEERHRGRFFTTGTVLTIHNMAFHGSFPAYQMELTGLPSEYFNWKQMEYWGQINLLKAGIAFADMVTTVSPTYAREICTPEYGYGLDPLLLERGDSLVGILNGVDPQIWNPAIDKYIDTKYDIDTFMTGKAKCKAALQKEMGLPVDEEACLFATITRLTDQKGLDLIAAQADQLLQARVQLVVLGTGDPRYETWLNELQQRYPNKVAAKVGFSEDLAHRMEAGCDVYLMPSRFEPCGLNQMYSQIYGAVPVVHTIGGLADSVVGATAKTLEDGTATGFSFDKYDAGLFLDTVWKAVGIYQFDKEMWRNIIKRGMTTDFSWSASAAKYVEVYERAIEQAGE